jgi:uncharacterized protein
MDFIGRQYEIGILQAAIDSKKAELGIVYGRRRVGKSTLLKKMMNRKGDLYFEGLQQASGKNQIAHFMDQLAEQTASMRLVAHDWKDAFNALSTLIDKGKSYIVFDEFPWMAAGRTELVSLIKYYWDNVWKQNPKLTLVICGSVASFMTKHIIHSQALHNRKTFEIKLNPLTAHEVHPLFKKYRSDYETLKFLMVFGGIPKYLEQINPKKSFSETVDELCFRSQCFFLNEFETLFKEQFKVIHYYGDIVRALAKKSFSKQALAQVLHKSSGGGLSEYIKNLESADFVKTFTPHSLTGQGSKTKRIYLWDEWLRFYFTFMEPHRDVIAENPGPGFFESISSKSFDAYCGLAFERLCLKNLSSILDSLHIPLEHVKGYGPFFRQSARTHVEEGIQIDLLIERKGRVLTLLECKYRINPIGMSVITDIERKLRLLKAPQTYSIERVLVAPGGVSTDLEGDGYFHRILGAEAVLG